jgi:hypothetical protein
MRSRGLFAWTKARPGYLLKYPGGKGSGRGVPGRKALKWYVYCARRDGSFLQICKIQRAYSSGRREHAIKQKGQNCGKEVDAKGITSKSEIYMPNQPNTVNIIKKSDTVEVRSTQRREQKCMQRKDLKERDH